MKNGILKFGFICEDLEYYQTDNISVQNLNLKEKYKELRRRSDIHKLIGHNSNWVFSNPITNGFHDRIFRLPHTHTINIKNKDSDEHEIFHVNCLSFFTGNLLSHHQDGWHLDAVLIKSGNRSSSHLSPFFIPYQKYEECAKLAENFWNKCKSIDKFNIRFENMVRWFFLSQIPQIHEYEKFKQFGDTFHIFWRLLNDISKLECSTDFFTEERVSTSCLFEGIRDYYELEFPKDWISKVSYLYEHLEYEPMARGTIREYGFLELDFQILHDMKRLFAFLLFAMIIGRDDVIKSKSVFSIEEIFNNSRVVCLLPSAD